MPVHLVKTIDFFDVQGKSVNEKKKHFLNIPSNLYVYPSYNVMIIFWVELSAITHKL